jgi:hypothetical protein
VRDEMRRRCVALVDELDLPEPFDMNAFCEAVGRRRGRALRRIPADLPTGSPSGMWVATADADYVFFERRTTPLHRRHIVLHELGHLICNHEAPPEMTDTTSRLLLPDLDPSVEEQQAELVASLIHERISAWGPEPSPTVDPAVADVVARLERVFRS